MRFVGLGQRTLDESVFGIYNRGLGIRVEQVNDSLRKTLQEALENAIVRTVPVEAAPEASSGNQKAMERSAEKAGNW